MSQYFVYEFQNRPPIRGIQEDGICYLAVHDLALGAGIKNPRRALSVHGLHTIVRRVPGRRGCRTVSFLSIREARCLLSASRTDAAAEFSRFFEECLMPELCRFERSLLCGENDGAFGEWLAAAPPCLKSLSLYDLQSKKRGDWE